ncbi:MAG: hypothetical protein SH850_31130 [Planctomycetaceae bacterium]|nr:hypothetical protein [Planctomycetaceae bacterium]
MTAPRRGPGLLFYLAAPVNVWFNAHAGTLLAAEVVAIAVLGVTAMGRDQWLQRRETFAVDNSNVTEFRSVCPKQAPNFPDSVSIGQIDSTNRISRK